MGSIPSQTLTTGANAGLVDVAPYFQDPDNDQLTYLAVSEHPSILGVSVTGSTVILTPLSAGTARVTVTASDGNASATQTIAATVRVPREQSTDEAGAGNHAHRCRVRGRARATPEVFIDRDAATGRRRIA